MKSQKKTSLRQETAKKNTIMNLFQRFLLKQIARVVPNDYLRGMYQDMSSTNAAQ